MFVYKKNTTQILNVNAYTSQLKITSVYYKVQYLGRSNRYTM